jgi:hypothetical protein
MSDAEVRASLEQMEAWMADPSWEPEPGLLATWNAGFQAAMGRAEKGPNWPDLMSRAHALGRALERRASHLALQRDGVKAELDAQGRGNRALKGYGASTR